MSDKNLMEPRYEVLLDYPYTPFAVGMILIVDKGELYSKQYGYVSSKSIVTEDVAKKHPAIFYPLPWYAQRKTEDMPPFMKVITDNINGHNVLGRVFKAEPGGLRRSYEGFSVDKDGYVDGFDNVLLNCFEPATEQDYFDYINKVK